MEKLIPKLAHKAPLPFAGQKRNFLKMYRGVLDEHIPGDGAGWTIIDAFGGSGLLSNNAKALKPKARVIFNDYDNYASRLNHIADYNRLRQLLSDVLSGYPKHKHIDADTKAAIIKVIKSFDGYINMRILSSWLLFGGNNANSLDELFKLHMYNCLRKSDYDAADDYLTGVEIVKESYETLLPKHTDNPKALFVLDPPYVNTEQGSYAQDQYFGMIAFLTLMSHVRPPFIFFSSTRSELLDYLEFIKRSDPITHSRLSGYQRLDLDVTLNKTAKYTDHLIYKF